MLCRRPVYPIMPVYGYVVLVGTGGPVIARYFPWCRVCVLVAVVRMRTVSLVVAIRAP